MTCWLFGIVIGWQVVIFLPFNWNLILSTWKNCPSVTINRQKVFCCALGCNRYTLTSIKYTSGTQTDHMQRPSNFLYFFWKCQGVPILSVRHAFLKCHIMMSNLPCIGNNMARLCLQIILKLNRDDLGLYTDLLLWDVVRPSQFLFSNPNPPNHPNSTTLPHHTTPPHPTPSHTAVPTVYHLHTALYRYRNNNLRYSVRPSHFFLSSSSQVLSCNAAKLHYIDCIFGG